MQDEAADYYVGPPIIGKHEAVEKAVVPPYHIGTLTELAAGYGQRGRVGFDADQARFGTVCHQGPQ